MSTLMQQRAGKVTLRGLKSGLRELWAGHNRAIRATHEAFANERLDDARLSLELADGFKLRIDALTKELDTLL
jgi:hypothetical protein